MKRDIVHPKVEGIAMAVVHEHDEDGSAWYVYLINQKDVPLETVLVSSRGYGELDGEPRRTGELRHFLDRLEPRSFARIEHITEELFALNNQYWVSFYVDGVIHDKKYIFLPESIVEDNFTEVPFMGKRGVMIQ